MVSKQWFLKSKSCYSGSEESMNSTFCCLLLVSCFKIIPKVSPVDIKWFISSHSETIYRMLRIFFFSATSVVFPKFTKCDTRTKVDMWQKWRRCGDKVNMLCRSKLGLWLWYLCSFSATWEVVPSCVSKETYSEATCYWYAGSEIGWSGGKEIA